MKRQDDRQQKHETKHKLNDGDFELTKDSLEAIGYMAGQLPVGFLLYQEGESRDILYVNRLLLDIFECESVEEFRELTGYDFHGMVHPDDVQMVQDSINRQIKAKYGSYDHVEYRIITKSGAVRWLDDYGHFSWSRDFGDVFYVFLFDITEKRHAQEAKKLFYYNMSHELLNPMNAVSTCIMLARNHMDDPVLLDRYLREADEAAKRMTSQIDEMVEINRELEIGISPVVHRPLRILIAEDNELNRLLLETILEDNGFLVDAVDNGEKAVDMVRQHGAAHYDVVLMDIQMPVMGGYEATRLIRDIPDADEGQLPILALSANSRDEDREASRMHGMNEHLAKPYNPTQIISTIYRYAKP
ncbi:MAG: response regulator [Oscillospiraceae bacterium]|nr:response regulator [Oscillospiraceae bacterium]